MNEKWRDYRKYTDPQLDDLLKGFAGQADYPAVAFEYQRRQKTFEKEVINFIRRKKSRPYRRSQVFCRMTHE